MKIWKEAQTVQLDLVEASELLKKNFKHLSECNFENYSTDDWSELYNQIDSIQQMIEAIVSRLSN